MLLQISCNGNRFARIPLGVSLALFLLVLAGLWTAPARAQISPGPLSRAHQSLSGALNCTKCHDLGAGGAQLKCLECHTEIRQRVAQGRGMHAVWLGQNPTGKDCARCHSEHNGADFPLIRWEPSREAMDHSKTGFALDGHHAKVQCADCHNSRNIPASARPGILVKDLNHTYLGLSSDCKSCHADEHHGQLSANCASCHNTSAWKPAPSFNHAAAKFALTGTHAKVACSKCHPSVPAAKTYVKYTGLSFEKCTGCHTDPHKGSFTAPCESCHNTTNWKHVAQLENFSHSRTKFPLLGKHQAVACSDCHTHGDFKTPVAHAKCMDCHQDAHQGQFTARADGGECAACHTVDGFKPSTFGVKEHAATSYPLVGRHASVRCEKCHLPKGKETIFKIKQIQCRDCHDDIHKGQFAAAPHLNRCEDCHNLQGFRPAQFSLSRHQQTRFPLTGAHLAIPCVECHASTPGSIVPVKYRFEDRSCAACHQDPHRGEFRKQMAAKGAGGLTVGCEACHTTATWKELAKFDHAKTVFPLTGAHRGVACADCHRPPDLETTMEHADFHAAPTLCSGCHEDPHAGQFAARKEVKDCSSCHSSARWKPSDFNHNTRTNFPLEGAHRDVACADCHKLMRHMNARNVLFYSPTPRECKACHGNL
jgi:hypothetical protein